jgi:hypothetical protein
MSQRKTGPRQPVQLEFKGGKSQRQRIWEALRAQQGSFTLYTLARRADADDETAQSYLQALVRAGYVQCHTPADAPPATVRHYSLLRDNGVEAPRLTRRGQPVSQGMGTEAMWRAMHITRDFTCRELVAYASAGGVVVSEDSANSYIRTLRLAGYLAITVPAATKGIGKGKTLARYALQPGRYTGPRPPMIQRTKSLYDPNLGRVVWQQEPNDDDY